MASFTLERPSVFPNGTVVSAYAVSNWPDEQPSGAPRGAAAASGTVASDKVELTGLTENVAYTATAEVGGVRRYVAFVIAAPEEEAGGSSPVASRKALGVAARTPEEYGAKAEAGHDDALSITEAIAAVVAEGQANGSNYGEILFSAKTYRIERAPVKGSEVTKGNAQIPLPIIDPKTSQKFTLVLKGVLDATAFVPHWEQESVQQGATVLDSMLTEGASDATWGVPSVIGGPTKFAAPSGGVAFSNMHLVTDGLVIRQKLNPPVIGCDTRQLAAHNIIKMACTVRATPAEMNASLPTNELGIGVYLPLCGNNDDNNIDWLTTYGHYSGLIAAEHLVANRIANIYGNKGMVFVAIQNKGGGPEAKGGASHGGVIQYLSSEVMKTCHLEGVGASTSRIPIVINQLSCEFGATTYDIVDTNSILMGDITWENVTGNPGAGEPPRLNGATRLRIINQFRERGGAAAKAVPASGAEVQNTYWRDAFFTIAGGTGLEVFIGGTKIEGFPATGGQGIVLPAGMKMKLVYTGAPTFSGWVLL